MLFDIHCHLDGCEAPGSVVDRAVQAGVGLIVTNGTGPADNVVALELEQQYSVVRAALGLYPNDALGLSEEELQRALEFIEKQRPVAVGEVGLDYHYDARHVSEMKSVFSQVLGVAERIKRPVIVHSRKAESDVLELLGSSSVVADLHCYGGKLKLVKQAVDRGCYFSIPATVVRATHFQRLVEETPLELLLSETDSPWQSPTSDQNEPRNVRLVVQEIARIKQLDLQECQEQLWKNCQRFIPAAHE